MSSHLDLMKTRRLTPYSSLSRDMMSDLELHRHMLHRMTDISRSIIMEETDTGLTDIRGQMDIQQSPDGSTQIMLKSM